MARGSLICQALLNREGELEHIWLFTLEGVGVVGGVGRVVIV